MSLQELLFVGFNGRVVALDQHSGELIWEWKCPKPSSSMVAILVEGRRVFASSSGYTYCLDASNGELLWHNPLAGMGTGVPCLATVSSNSGSSYLLQARAAEEEEAAAASVHSVGS